MPRPHIVYLHTHDTGRFVEPYGYPVPAPRLQRFAREGVLFRQAHSAAPTCSPSRAALLTGQSPHEAGMLGLAHLGFDLNDRQQHLIHTLRPAGYTTAMIGVQHVADGPREGDTLGYDEHLEAPDHLAASYAAVAADYLARDHDQPFFLSVGLVETHILVRDGHTFGYPPREEDLRTARPPAHLPDTPSTRRDWASYLASAKAADAAFGTVLDALEEHGLAQDTLVVVTTDHGVPLPGMKSTLSDLGTGVMLMMRGPGGFTGGRVVDDLVGQIDLFPTLCDLLEIPPPAWLTGRSLLPLLRGEDTGHEHLFSEVTYHVAYDPQRSVRTRRHRYVRRFDGRTRPVLPNVDDCPTKDELVAGGTAHWPVPTEALHDLLLDPGETVNLLAAAAPAPEILAERDRLDALLLEWMQTSHDPLLDGPVPQPRGYPYRDPDDVSAVAS